MDKNSQSSPTICQRLLNFILGVTSRSPMHPGPTIQVPIDEQGPSRNEKGPIKKPNAFVGSEIVVEFRHVDGSERLIDINKHEEPVLTGSKKKGGLISSDGNERNMDRLAGDRAKMANNNDRPNRPIVSVVSNINEKSDEYIRSRKKAMSRTFSHDQEKA